MEQVYIFGITGFAQMLRAYLKEDEQLNFKGYIVDDAYLPDEPMIDGQDPVITWTEFTNTVSPDEASLLSSVGYSNMNKNREILFNRIKEAGYRMANYIHPTCCIDPSSIMGEGNIFLERAIIQSHVTIGNNNIFGPQVLVGHHSSIGSFNFLSASVSVLGRVQVEDRCFLGANCSVRNRMKIGTATLIGMHGFANRDTEPGSVIMSARSVLLEKDSSEINI